MKALSIQMPWAWLIVNGWKDIENRSWKTNYRGRIYVHAGKKFDMKAFDWLIARKYLLPASDGVTALILWWNHSGIIGEVDIIDCVTESKSPWFTGKYGFVLANAKPYKPFIPYKGQQRFFEVNLTSGTGE